MVCVSAAHSLKVVIVSKYMFAKVCEKEGSFV
jgi:hypothetical protein